MREKAQGEIKVCIQSLILIFFKPNNQTYLFLDNFLYLIFI